MSYFNEHTDSVSYLWDPETGEKTTIPPLEIKEYSFWRIKRILKEDFHYRLDNVWQGYKCNRRPNYCELYNVVNEDTNEIVVERVSTKALRWLLSMYGYPLEDNPVKRNIGAERFLEIVNQLP